LRKSRREADADGDEVARTRCKRFWRGQTVMKRRLVVMVEEEVMDEVEIGVDKEGR
jgi:hypothetical protein